MKWCRCITKPITIRGLCHVCKLPPAPHESVIKITRPGIGVETIKVLQPA